MNITIIGSNGFVGKNLVKYLERQDIINELNIRFPFTSKLELKTNVVIHLAGKAHDLKITQNVPDYYIVNTDFAKKTFDDFLISEANVYIFFSSVKAVADVLHGDLTEEDNPNPITHYGKSKLLAEEYILSKQIPEGKRVYILRPCMIHGQGNKGNLNLLYNIVKKGFPWPLGAFYNQRSFCSIDNLCFIINELIKNDQISSGVYNLADDEPISTNELINLIAVGLGKKPHIWNVPRSLIKLFSKIGDLLSMPLNSERLSKLTETYIVSNNKIKNAINKPLPLGSKEGLINTINSFNNGQ